MYQDLKKELDVSVSESKTEQLGTSCEVKQGTVSVTLTNNISCMQTGSDSKNLELYLKQTWHVGKDDIAVVRDMNNVH